MNSRFAFYFSSVVSLFSAAFSSFSLFFGKQFENSSKVIAHRGQVFAVELWPQKPGTTGNWQLPLIPDHHPHTSPAFFTHHPLLFLTPLPPKQTQTQAHSSPHINAHFLTSRDPCRSPKAIDAIL